MIPVLYSETERDYGHGGIGVLTDTMTYLVTEEANGEFELYLEYPVQGSMFTELKNNRLIKAKPNDLDEDHVFRIYEVVKDLERQTVYIYATSITNDLGNNMVSSLKISSKTAQEALGMLKANLIEPTHFNFVSDIATKSSTEWDFRNPLNCLVGEDGSMVKYWGGEVKRTNDTVYLYARRGRDNVAVLREGKNLEGLEMTISTKGIVTKILPYMIRYDDATGEERLIVGNIVTSPLVDNYPVKSIKAVDYTLYDDVETAAELNALAGGYFTYQNPGVDKPKVSIDIDIMQLADSPLYSQYSKLESLGLFDSVSVYIPRFDVSVIVKVNRIEYNGLLERAEKIQCGDPVGNIFDDVKAGYTNMIVDSEAKITNIVQRAANGVSSIFRGTDEPTIGVKTGDLWYKPIGEFEIEMYQWNGMEWELILSTKELNMYRPLIESAIEAAEQAKLDAEQAYLDSVAEAERLVTAQTEAFDAEMTERQNEIADAKDQADLAISKADSNANAIFGKLDAATYEANKTAVETELGKKLATATYNAQKQTQDALIAGKVATNTYNAKVTELNSLIDAAQSKADTAATDLLKKADTTFVNTELAKKLATSTYNTKMASLDTAISGHNTRIKATEDGLALTATKVEVDAVRTRMSEAETEISQNSDAITLKASQSSLDTTNSKLATAEAALVVQAGQIESKVSQTDFNALNGRVGTAESSITQQASQIASKVSQTDFNALNGRVGTAESSITQQAGRIDLAATKTELNTAIDGIEVGGRNLLRDSHFNGGSVSGWSSTYGTQVVEEGIYKKTFVSLSTAARLERDFTNLEVGEHTFTIFAKTPVALEWRGFIGTDAVNKKQIGSPDVFKRYSITFNVVTAGNVKVRAYTPNIPVGSVIEIDWEKLEKGNKATDWTPAPEDVDATISTVQSNLTVQAGEIASKVSQTDFNALSGRVGTAESSISQQAGEIALRVTTATYNTGIGSKENTITKANTAPAHLNGRLWLDTSVTPNVLKRSTGSAWVKVTPTTAGEVGAYSASAGSTLAGRVTTAETSITANTTAINLRATKTDLDAAKGRLTTAEGAINVQAGQIALKANQTTVDTLTGRVGTAETNISANTTAINLRATKSSVDTLTGRVTTAEGSITTQAGQIALKANTTTVNALTGRVSTAESTISANTTAINLRATKTELTTAIDGIEVGGRNLLLNTKGITMTSSDNGNNNLSVVGGDGTVTITPKNNGNVYNNGGFKTGVDRVQGETYTLSFDINTTRTYSMYWRPSNSKTLSIPNTSGKWQKFTHTYTQAGATKLANTGFLVGFAGLIAGEPVKYRGFKLEKGNKATDWTPAPEDVEASIATVQSNLTVEAGKITALTTRVSGSETNITSVTQTVSGINTTISTLRTDVDGKATIVSLNQVKSTADGNKTTISNHAGRLTTVETTVSGLQTTVADKADKSQITQLTTSISTKVESATYNSKMTQLDNAINLRVVQGDVTAAILADKKIKDTRTTNQLPSWYFTNYPAQRVEEFKNRTVIGVPGAAANVKLVTDVPWSNTTGGVVAQTAYSSDGIYTRSGNSAATAWGSWVKQTDSSSVLAQINLSTEGVLIQGKRIQLDGDVAMNAAYITRLNTQTLSAITANITSIRSQVLVTDSVTSTHIKAENALIDGIFATTALITRLTSKTAFVNNIKAITISADKVTTGTLNAANVNIINLNASSIVANSLSALSTNTGALTVSGNISLVSINSGIVSYFDFFEAEAYNPRRFAGNMNLSLNSLTYRGDMFRNETNNTGHLGYGNTEYGLDSIKHRVYDNRNSMQLNYRIDMFQGRIEVSNGWAILDDKTTVITGGTVQTGRLLGKMGVTTPRIDLPTNYNTFQINEAWALGIPRLSLANNHYGFTIDTPLTTYAQISVGTDDNSKPRVWFERGVYDRTYSDSPNMYVTGSGTIGRAVSARKYKTDIREEVALRAKEALSISPSSWLDKNDILKGRPNIRHYGFIADDFDAAGLKEVVHYGQDGSVEGLAYDRISMYHNLILRDHETDITRIDTFVSQHDIEIDNLQKENESLRQRIELLEEKVE